MKKIIIVLIILFFASCKISYNQMTVVKVKEVKSNYKYIVYLESYPFNHKLYTDTLYSVGDRLCKCKVK